MATTLIPFTFLSSKALRNILPILPKPFIATLILLPILYCYHDEDVFKVFCLSPTLTQSTFQYNNSYIVFLYRFFMTKTKLEQAVENMVAFKVITSTTGSISDRAKRKLEAFGSEVYDRLKEDQKVSEDAVVEARIRWEDKMVAKGMKLGIQEFKQQYPQEGEVLQQIIDTHRGARRAYIDFNAREELPQDFYLDVIKSFGLTPRQAIKVYEAVMTLQESLG